METLRASAWLDAVTGAGLSSPVNRCRKVSSPLTPWQSAQCLDRGRGLAGHLPSWHRCVDCGMRAGRPCGWRRLLTLGHELVGTCWPKSGGLLVALGRRSFLGLMCLSLCKYAEAHGPSTWSGDWEKSEPLPDTARGHQLRGREPGLLARLQHGMTMSMGHPQPLREAQVTPLGSSPLPSPAG